MTQPHNLTRYQNASFVDLKLYLYKIIFKKKLKNCVSQQDSCMTVVTAHPSVPIKSFKRVAQPYGLGQIPETSVQTRGI